jgi:hypothetical protein
MSISKLAASGATTPSTIRLVGRIEDQEVLILVDSGSSHCFISDSIASKLHVHSQQVPASRVRVAGGGILSCDRQIPNCVWSAQGHSFATDLRVLSLGCYDMILGMDWLEEMGDMNISLVHKSMKFHYNGISVHL